jgi:hypothetical protein
LSYDYNKPSRLNLVSLFFVLLIAAGAYAAAKFIPVYYQAKEVDRELDELKTRASDFNRYDETYRRKTSEEIVLKATAAIHALGIEDQPDQPVEVWFSPDYGEISARYQVVVHHPGEVIKPTIMHMERTVTVPR